VADPPVADTEFRDWFVSLKYTELFCPICKRSIAVLEGCTAWCTRCPGRPEMTEAAP
jgi:hypothetical protein